MTVIKREVQIGDCRLILGDCLAVLPLLPTVDAVITDPPFGVEGGQGSNRIKGKSNYAAAFEDTPQYIAEVCVPAIEIALSLASRGAITTGIRCMGAYPTPADIGCFYHPGTASCGPWGFVTFSPILYYGKDFRAGLGSLPSSTVVKDNAIKNGHPCPRPPKAWSWLVDKASQEGETVLDPFMGSGTTGVMCAAMGRKFIGIELDPTYFDIACERIAAAHDQPDLFIKVPAPVQGRMEMAKVDG